MLSTDVSYTSLVPACYPELPEELPIQLIHHTRKLFLFSDRRIALFQVFRIVKEVDMVNPPTNPTARENPNQSVLTTQFILP